MQMGFELGPVGILTTDDEPLPDPSLEFGPQAFGNCLEVLQSFLGDATFGVAGFVAVIAVAGSTAREHVDNGSAFAQVVQAQIEEAGALAVDHGNAEGGLSTQQSGQRFQLKMRLEINVRASEMRR